MSGGGALGQHSNIITFKYILNLTLFFTAKLIVVRTVEYILYTGISLKGHSGHNGI